MNTLSRYLTLLCVIISASWNAYSQTDAADEPLEGVAARVVTFFKDSKACDAAFPYEIQSITFSKTDSEGYLHEDYVSQIITLKSGDTVIKPLGDFDSASFKPYGPIYREGVIVLDESDLYPYLISATNGDIIVDRSVPSSLLPSPGDYIVCLKIGGPVKCGISAQVQNISSTDQGIDIKCVTVDPPQLIESYAAAAIIGSESESPATRSSAGDNIQHGKNSFKREFKINLKALPEAFSEIKITVPSKGLGLSRSFGIGLNYKYTIDKTIFTTYRIFGGYKSISCRDVTTISHETDVEANGNISISKEFFNDKWKEGVKLKGELTIPQCPLLELFWDVKLDANLELNGEYSFSSVKSKTIETSYEYTDNPNMAPMPKPHKDVIDEKDEFNANGSGELEFTIGPTIDIGIQTAGYNKLKFIEVGAKYYCSFSGGLRLSSDDWKVNDQINIGNTGLNTGFYDLYAPQCKFDFGPYARIDWHLDAGIKIKTESDMEFEWQPLQLGNTLWNPEIKPFFERAFYPTFSDVRFTPKELGAHNIFDAKIAGKLMRPVKVGYKVLDGNHNEITKKLFDMSYNEANKDFNNFIMAVDGLEQMEAKDAYIYPLIVRENGQEILASPRVQIAGVAEPVTLRVNEVTQQSASVYGKIKSFSFMSPTASVGFSYCEAGSQMLNAAQVTCTPDESGKFMAAISGLQPGKTYIVAAFMEDGGERVMGETIEFTTLKPDYVDLGLSVDWAVSNIGAAAPSDYGDMFAWGEVASKADYTWSTYFDSPYDASGVWTGCQKQTASISGDADFDAAKASDAIMRMPTVDEFQELVNGCDWEWGELDGTAGFYVKSRVNANYIFLPAVGTADGSALKNRGTYGGYWSGTLRDTDDHNTAANLYFVKSMKSTQYSNRYIGRAIRGVHPKD